MSCDSPFPEVSLKKKKTKSQDDIKDAECGWAPETPEWDVKADHQMGTLSQEQAAERNHLQWDPHPHPMNMSFYIQPLRP